MSEPDVATWTRQQVEADLAAARIISSGGFSPQRWDTEPPGQVNPEDIPQSDAVTAALGCAPQYICGWVQVVAYDKFSDEADEAYQRDSGTPFALVDNGRREADHIIRNDPRNVVARCEAELAILDACRQGIRNGRAFLAEEIVRLLASGYRHRPGYEEAGWGKG